MFLPVTAQGSKVRRTVHVAMAIAQSDGKTCQAVWHLDDLCSAPGTMESKNALFVTWGKIAHSRATLF